MRPDGSAFWICGVYHPIYSRIPVNLGKSPGQECKSKVGDLERDSEGGFGNEV